MRKTFQQFSAALLLVGSIAFLSTPVCVRASGGSGGGGAKVDTIKVSKCYYDAPTGEMLIKASSSDPTATLQAYTLDGAILGRGWVQNGGGSRYGGTVMGYVGADPVYVKISSSSGGSIIVQTTPFQI